MKGDRQSTKMIVSQENENHQVPWKHAIMSWTVYCPLGLWLNLKPYEKEKNTRIFRSKQAWSEVKSDDTIKVFNRDRGNIVNKTSWRPLLRKIDLIT